MPELPERKAGIVACSGEELAEGTVTRLAALKVLQRAAPAGHGDHLPAAVPGRRRRRPGVCPVPSDHHRGRLRLRCAARATEMHSGKPAASIVVNDLVAQHGLDKPEGRRRLNEAGQQAVELTAERLAALVDEVLGKKGTPAALRGRRRSGRADRGRGHLLLRLGHPRHEAGDRRQDGGTGGAAADLPAVPRGRPRPG